MLCKQLKKLLKIFQKAALLTAVFCLCGLTLVRMKKHTLLDKECVKGLFWNKRSTSAAVSLLGLFLFVYVLHSSPSID